MASSSSAGKQITRPPKSPSPEGTIVVGGGSGGLNPTEPITLSTAGTFQDAAQALDYIQNQPRERQYVFLEQLSTALDKVQDIALDMQEEIITYLDNQALWQGHLTEAVYYQTWEDTREKVARRKDQKSKIESAGARIIDRWGQDVWDRVFEGQAMSHNYVEAMRAFAIKCPDWQSAARSLLTVYHERMTKRSRGMRSAQELLASDWRKAAELYASTGKTAFVDDATLRNAEDTKSLHVLMLQPKVRAPRLSLKSQSESESPRKGTASPSTPSTSSTLTHRTRPSLGGSLDFSVGFGGTPPTAADILGPPSSIPDTPTRPRYYTRSTGRLGTVSELPGPEPGVQGTSQIATSHCSLCTGISDGLIDSIDACNKEVASCIRVVSRLAQERKDGGSLCFQHRKKLAGTCGFQVRALDSDQIWERLKAYYKHRMDIAKLKTDKDTCHWFRASDRPARPADAMGHYKYMHVELNTPEIALKALENWMKVKGGSFEEIFEWIFEPEDLEPGQLPLSQLLRDEFDMYRHHLRERGNVDNYGWLRNQYYSVFQQVIRQSPAYYACYVTLRENHCYRLISYPYYTKFQVPGDSTFFRHIDINNPQAVREGRGSNMIQGSVSLDDEAPDDCTELLLGMHKNLKEWWADVAERYKAKGKLLPDGHVTRIDQDMWTPEDRSKYHLDFVSQPCRAGEVRISSPLVPHGARGPAKNFRRTILPWYMAIKDDHQTLDTIEAGTWNDLSNAHRDLLPGPKSPSGLANRFSAPPYAFPAAVQVTGLGAVSDALVGRVRWTNPAVINDMSIILGRDNVAREQFIAEWEVEARVEIRRCMEMVEGAERLVFREKSFFYLRERGRAAPLADDPGPLSDVEREVVSATVARAVSEQPSPADHY